MIEKDTYLKLHTAPLVPTNMVINIDNFYISMQKYKYAFRSWGEKKKHMPRYGLPLVNREGNLYNNPEPVCYPLDEWIENMTQEEKANNLDRNFNVKTEVLDEVCFDSLSSIKQYMIRSCILRWDKETFFHPHTDTWFPSPILRLWGTNEPDKVKIRFDKNLQRSNPWEVPNEETIELRDFEDIIIDPGRLYVIDTNIIHSARSLVNEPTYQFFIALHSDGYSLIKDLVHV